MELKRYNDFVNENAGNEPVEVAKFNYDGDDIIIYLYKTSPFENYFYAVDVTEGEDYGDVSTKLPGNDLMDAIWVKVGGFEEEFANKLVDNNILTNTEVTTSGGMNTYRKYDIN